MITDFYKLATIKEKGQRLAVQKHELFLSVNIILITNNFIFVGKKIILQTGSTYYNFSCSQFLTFTDYNSSHYSNNSNNLIV